MSSSLAPASGLPVPSGAVKTTVLALKSAPWFTDKRDLVQIRAMPAAPGVRLQRLRWASG